MFRARLPSMFIRLPRNLHLVATWRSPDNKIPKKNTKTRHVWSAAPATKTAMHPLKTSRKYCACHTKNFRHVKKHVWMSRSATLATRNEATRRWKPAKVTPFDGGIHTWSSHDSAFGFASGKGLQLSAQGSLAYGPRRNGCGRLQTVANGCATSSEHSLNPQLDPQSETRTLATHSGKNMIIPWICHFTTIKQIATFVDSPVKPSWAARAKWSSARPRDERHPPNEGLALAAASLRDSLRGTKYFKKTPGSVCWGRLQQVGCPNGDGIS